MSVIGTLITHNEGIFLSLVLAWAKKYLTELVVLDGGSGRKTLQILNGFGITPVRHFEVEKLPKTSLDDKEFNKYKPLLQKAIESKVPDKNWILRLKPNELFSQNLGEYLLCYYVNSRSWNAYAFPVYIFNKRKELMLDNYPEFVISLIKKGEENLRVCYTADCHIYRYTNIEKKGKEFIGQHPYPLQNLVEYENGR